MPPVVIENSILDSPFGEPRRRFRFDDAVTADVLPGRLPTRYFVPIAAPKRNSKQRTHDSLLETKRLLEADEFNSIRAGVTSSPR